MTFVKILASSVCVCACTHTHAQSCLTLCNPMDSSPPSSFIHGISQAGILELVAISFSKGSSWPKDRTHIPCVSCSGRWVLYQLSHQGLCMLNHFIHVQIFATLWTVACQAPLSIGFSRQQYWSGLPCPPPGDLPNPGIEPTSLVSPTLAGGFFTTSATWEEHLNI